MKQCIFITASGNRIDNNTCAVNAIGLRVDGSRNLITRNTCDSNTSGNWLIAANNAVATIIQAARNTSTINANAYTGSLGSTDPNANITH